MEALTDSELAYWLGVLISARRTGNAKRLEDALKALARGGVMIAFAEGESPRKTEAAVSDA